MLFLESTADRLPETYGAFITIADKKRNNEFPGGFWLAEIKAHVAGFVEED
jgi:hypothetical protein